jgi:hypothetical protein
MLFELDPLGDPDDGMIAVHTGCTDGSGHKAIAVLNIDRARIKIEKEKIDVQGIVKEYLEEHGFDGLAADDCGCSKADLFPCDGYFGNCRPAHRVIGGCAACTFECESRGEIDETGECFQVEKQPEKKNG